MHVSRRVSASLLPYYAQASLLNSDSVGCVAHALLLPMGDFFMGLLDSSVRLSTRDNRLLAARSNTLFTWVDEVKVQFVMSKECVHWSNQAWCGTKQLNFGRSRWKNVLSLMDNATVNVQGTKKRRRKIRSFEPMGRAGTTASTKVARNLMNMRFNLPTFLSFLPLLGTSLAARRDCVRAVRADSGTWGSYCQFVRQHQGHLELSYRL